MDIETRLANLEELVFSYIKNQQKKETYINADINGTKYTISETVDALSQDVSDTDICMNAIAELYEKMGE